MNIINNHAGGQGRWLTILSETINGEVVQIRQQLDSLADSLEARPSEFIVCAVDADGKPVTAQRVGDFWTAFCILKEAQRRNDSAVGFLDFLSVQKSFDGGRSIPNDRVPKVRRRIEDHLRKNPSVVRQVADLLNISLEGGVE